MAFQSEHTILDLTVIATAAITAGNPVSAAGAVSTGPANFLGVAMSDAEIGEALPVRVLGTVAVLVASGSSGVAVDAGVAWDTDGYDTAAGSQSYAKALDAGAAGATIRIFVNAKVAAAAAAALTAADGGTVDTTWGADEVGVLTNAVTRIGEIEAALVAAGILTA